MDFQRGLRGETRTRASLFIGYWLSVVGKEETSVVPLVTGIVRITATAD